MKIKDVVKAMKSTDQIKDRQTVWEHGICVKFHVQEIFNFLEDKGSIEGYIPSWLLDYKQDILSLIWDKKLIKRAAFWHDLGKPSVRLLDGD